ncbi:hypothetical protein LXL04_021374 [Taraxacum kok-saghyz]
MKVLKFPSLFRSLDQIGRINLSARSRGDATERRGGERRLSVAVLMDGDGFWPQSKMDDIRNERRKKLAERKKGVDHICEKQGKPLQKDAKINPEFRRKNVSKTGKRLDSKTIKKKPEIGRRALNCDAK